MDNQMKAVGISISVSVVILFILIYFLGYRASKANKQHPTKTKAGKPDNFIRHRPSPLNLDQVRVKRLSSQLTPKPLVITPTTQNMFTIPSRPHQSEDYRRSVSSISGPDGVSNLSPSVPLVHEKLCRTISMYEEGYGAQTKEIPFTPHGKIECFLKHDELKNCLLVQILGKKGHSLSWLTGISNPYIRVTLIPNQHCEPTREISPRILNIPSNPRCQLQGVTKEDLKDGFLKFVVLDFDRFSRSEFVAEVMVSLRELENLSNGVTVCEDLVLQQKVVLASRGSLLISLCNQSVAQQLQVILMKADGIPSKSHVSLTGSDLCVKTTLETTEACYARKTKGHRKNNSYVFNEKLIFEVRSELLTNACLTFEVTRGDSKLLSESRIGLVKLGLDSNQALEIRHWSEMLASPQKQIAEWHQLRR